MLSVVGIEVAFGGKFDATRSLTMFFCTFNAGEKGGFRLGEGRKERRCGNAWNENERILKMAGFRSGLWLGRTDVVELKSSLSVASAGVFRPPCRSLYIKYCQSCIQANEER